jgi:hypothetical protein
MVDESSGAQGQLEREVLPIRKVAPAEPARRPEVSAGEVKRLIGAARKHSLGEEFLLEGYPESVAITFGVHPFVVNAAREVLRARKGRR